MVQSKASDSSKSSGRPKTYSAERVRQGEIILRKPWQRAVFIAGLVGCVIFLLVFYFAAAH